MKEQDTPKIAVAKILDEEMPNVVLPPSSPPLEKEEKKVSLRQSFILRLLKGFFAFFFDSLEVTVVASSIFVVIYLFFVQPHEVKGISMEPNFHNNEYILTDKISFRFEEPKRGDVVIFHSPTNPEVDYIKRIICLPKETCKIQNGAVYVNGQKLTEKYLTEPTFLYPGSYLKEGEEITLQEDEYLVLGDNRSHSSDSREFGPISRRMIVGRAFLRYWPLPKAGAIPRINYPVDNF